MPLEIRIFLGYQQNKELYLHLKRSRRWQEAKKLNSTGLEETMWKENRYIGLFIPSSLNILQIKEKEESLKCQLQFYCPKLNFDRLSGFLFSQLFIY